MVSHDIRGDVERPVTLDIHVYVPFWDWPHVEYNHQYYGDDDCDKDADERDPERGSSETPCAPLLIQTRRSVSVPWNTMGFSKHVSRPSFVEGDLLDQLWVLAGTNHYIWPYTKLRDVIAHPCSNLPLWLRHGWIITPWASYQICKIAGRACTRNAGNLFPATEFEGNCYIAIPACITARALMHVGIAYPRWRGKRSQHSRRMRNPQFYVSGKKPISVDVIAYPCRNLKLCYWQKRP